MDLMAGERAPIEMSGRPAAGQRGDARHAAGRPAAFADPAAADYVATTDTAEYAAADSTATDPAPRGALLHPPPTTPPFPSPCPAQRPALATTPHLQNIFTSPQTGSHTLGLSGPKLMRFCCVNRKPGQTPFFGGPTPTPEPLPNAEARPPRPHRHRRRLHRRWRSWRTR